VVIKQLNLTTHMAKHANLTAQTTVMSRDSLPTEPDTIPVNKIASPSRQILAKAPVKKYSQSVADNQMTYAKECLYKHTTANNGFSF